MGDIEYLMEQLPDCLHGEKSQHSDQNPAY